MKLYLVGIKGSGMSALANYLLDLNYDIEGTDISEELFTEKQLISRGVVISNIKELNLNKINADLVVYSSAYKDSEIVKKLKTIYPSFEYHEFISLLLANKKIIAICGTHGKTTACNMLDLVLDYKTSIIEGDGVGRANKNSDYVILEACEYLDHFLSYKPYISLVLPLSLDHTDYFLTFENYKASFEKFIKQTKYVYISNENKKYKLKGTYIENNKNKVNYSFMDINKCELSYKIDGIKYPKLILPFNSDHEVKISLASLVLANKLKFDIKKAISNLKSYKGPNRRMKIYKENGDIYIDDYAHQPEQMLEVYSFIERVKENRKRILFYKPDRISRLLDFKEEFKMVFTKFDNVYLIPYHDIGEEILKDFVTSKIKMYKDLKLNDNEKYVFAFLTSKNVTNEINEIKSKRKDLPK